MIDSEKLCIRYCFLAGGTVAAHTQTTMRLGKFIASLIGYAEDERRKLEAGILGTALQNLEQPHCTTAVLSASEV
ncbi:MAG: hypothetical protein JO119_08655 [Acidobacteria bacterium]|nr:hypothetical protein [Acidobacteriota bacterium]